MEVLIVTVFVSLMLVVGGLVLYVSRLRGGDFEHGDRLSLLPLEEDEIEDAEAGKDSADVDEMKTNSLEA